jgi:hypothetical protein
MDADWRGLIQKSFGHEKAQEAQNEFLRYALAPFGPFTASLREAAWHSFATSNALP